MSEEKRYYVADNTDAIIEYPANMIHTPIRTVTGESQYTKVLPEHQIAHDRNIFKLHPAVAEAAIAVWAEAKRQMTKANPYMD